MEIWQGREEVLEEDVITIHKLISNIYLNFENIKKKQENCRSHQNKGRENLKDVMGKDFLMNMDNFSVEEREIFDKTVLAKNKIIFLPEGSNIFFGKCKIEANKKGKYSDFRKLLNCHVILGLLSYTSGLFNFWEWSHVLQKNLSKNIAQVLKLSLVSYKCMGPNVQTPKITERHYAPCGPLLLVVSNNTSSGRASITVFKVLYSLLEVTSLVQIAQIVRVLELGPAR